MRIIYKYYLVVIGLITFIGYTFTLAPTIVELDTGELAAVQYTLGIAHPTGYPLFTLLGYLFIKIPLPLTPIYKSNLLALIWTLGSVLMFAMTLKLIFKNLKYFNDDKTSFLLHEDGNFIIITASLIYAFSRTIWMQATSIEVYSLHLLLLNTITFFYFKSVTTSGNEFKLNRYWVIFPFFLGLGFTNHLSLIYVVPGIIIFFFLKYRFKTRYFNELIILFLISLIPVITLYLLLMLRSAQNPVLNWGYPANLKQLLYHITGMQFRALAFNEYNSPLEVLLKFFKTMLFNPFNTIPAGGEFGLLVLPGIIGIYVMLKYYTKLGILFITFFITTLAVSINYRIYDIDSYFLLSYVSFAVFIGFGLLFISTTFRENKLILQTAAGVLIFLLMLQFLYNDRDLTQNNVYIFEDFTASVFDNLEPNSIIFCGDRDPYIATSYYYQHVMGRRQDVVKVVTPFLLAEDWYAKVLKHQSPDLLKISKNGTSLDISNKAVYVSLALYDNDKLLSALGFRKEHLIPEHMCFRYYPDSVYIPHKEVPIKLRLSGRRSTYTDDIEEYVITMLKSRVLYEKRYGREDRANEIINKFMKLHLRVNYLSGVEKEVPY